MCIRDSTRTGDSLSPEAIRDESAPAIATLAGHQAREKLRIGLGDPQELSYTVARIREFRLSILGYDFFQYGTPWSSRRYTAVDSIRTSRASTVVTPLNLTFEPFT